MVFPKGFSINKLVQISSSIITAAKRKINDELGGEEPILFLVFYIFTDGLFEMIYE